MVPKAPALSEVPHYVAPIPERVGGKGHHGQGGQEGRARGAGAGCHVAALRRSNP